MEHTLGVEVAPEYRSGLAGNQLDKSIVETTGGMRGAELQK